MYVRQRIIHFMLPFDSQSIIYGVFFIMQAMKKIKHIKEERIRRHIEAVSSAFILFMKTDFNFILAYRLQCFLNIFGYQHYFLFWRKLFV